MNWSPSFDAVGTRAHEAEILIWLLFAALAAMAAVAAFLVLRVLGWADVRHMAETENTKDPDHTAT